MGNQPVVPHFWDHTTIRRRAGHAWLAHAGEVIGDLAIE